MPVLLLDGTVPERAVLSFVQAGKATVEPSDLAVGNCKETQSDKIVGTMFLNASRLNILQPFKTQRSTIM